MKGILLSLSLMLSCSLSALDLELPAIFADQMVLQREQTVPVWGTTDPAAKIVVEFSGQKKITTANTAGHWRIDLRALQASAESKTLTVSASLKGETTTLSFSDVLVGEVWFAGGQSNMYRPFRMLATPAVDPQYEPIAEYLRNERDTTNDPLLRQYRAGRVSSPLVAQTVGRGNWSKAIPQEINEFGATAYFFARELRRELNVPVAIIACNLGSTRIEPWIAPEQFKANESWKNQYKESVAENQKKLKNWDDNTINAEHQRAMEAWKAGGENGRAPRKPEHPSRDKQVYGTLYNGMVHPIIPYAIKGALWYQGESNTGNDPEEYDLRLQALIEGWRSAWDQEKLFFYWCQLANYKEANDSPVGDEDTWALLQDRQRRALHIPDTGMAVLNDIGEARDIHPKNKVDAGKRLARWALNQAYGHDELVPSGPLFKEAVLVGTRVRVTFDHVGSGLTTATKHLLDPAVPTEAPLKRFQIRDTHGEWKWAQARIISSNKVEVWHPEVLTPAEVRYAWSANPEGANLYNKEGLPASLFKIDALPLQKPTSKESKYEPSVPSPTYSEVQYGDHQRNVLDFWQAHSEKPTPLVVVIHGGGWNGGSKELIHRFVDTQKLLDAGISVAAINYRLIKHSRELEPPVRGPLYDAARAIQFLRSKATTFNIDKSRVAATGGSAGACTSLWIAYHDDLADPDSADPVLRESTRLSCIAAIRAQTSLDPAQMKKWIPEVTYGAHAFGLDGFDTFLAERDNIMPWIKEYSPYSLLTADDPPTYLYYTSKPGTGKTKGDFTHSAFFGTGLLERLQERGVPSELYFPDAPNAPHENATDYLISTLVKK